MATEPGVLTLAEIAEPPVMDLRPWVAGSKAFRNRLGARLNRLGLRHTNFTVISNDCWGQALYEEWGLPCRTPMAGSGMHADCFLRFLEDIPGHLRSPLRFVQRSRHASVNRLRLRREPWPMAAIGDRVEIHFMHYRTERESQQVWEQGCASVNLDRLAIKFTVDKDGALPEHIERFNAMQFERKLLISERAYPEVSCALQVPNYILNGAMMFRRSLRSFDCAHWLNTGEIKRTTPRVLLNKLIYLRGV